MSFFEQTTEHRVGPVHLRVYPMQVSRVISIAGSFDLWPDVHAGEELLASVTAAMLDKGSRQRDRFELASILEDRGARVTFSVSGTRLDMAAHLLADDLPEVMAVLGEQVCSPAFESAELEKLRARLLGSIRRNATEPAVLASAALSGRLFPPGHPNREESPEREEQWLDALTREDVESFHRRTFRGAGVRMAVAGDVDSGALVEAVAAAFAPWNLEMAIPRVYPRVGPVEPSTETVPLPDRPNLEVRMGHAVELRRNDPDYEPLVLGCFALGGNFSARLMGRVRDDLGLTYGISSGLRGVDIHHGGAWRTSVTLSADRLDEGLAATRTELERFVAEGLRNEEVEEKAETLAGQFSVSLSTTSAVAEALLSTLERGESLDRFDGYAGRMRSYGVDQVNETVRRWLDPRRLVTAVAGTVIRSER